VYLFARFNFWVRIYQKELKLILWKMEASTKIEALENMVNKKPRKNSTRTISV